MSGPPRPAGWRRGALAAACAACTAGCTSFATVRSAEVRPGPALGVQASLSTPPGDVAGWFWSYDCAERCDHRIPGGDLGVSYGWRPAEGPRGVALALGTSGTHPYVDGYLQLGDGAVPFGIGARGGMPIGSWREHQLYGRVDVPLGADTRLLLNPALFLHEGRAPNGESPGTSGPSFRASGSGSTTGGCRGRRRWRSSPGAGSGPATAAATARSAPSSPPRRSG